MILQNSTLMKLMLSHYGLFMGSMFYNNVLLFVAMFSKASKFKTKNTIEFKFILNSNNKPLN